ncbi:MULTISPECIES: glutaredoxin 3 [Paenirhodobacter]|uniref:Glutaredoxin n=2 Tax=Paenirhodobacter TaxID=1470577 RepID=A0A421BW21_9RHOB|nr:MULTISPECIES: glutaredoxin 3 [Sinirhodobacter]RLL72349.1 glutaredoxin 3 [Sinirhodobacter hankyongi]RWR48758.1 glutaredoxin 3 [Sinirhodobacter ferrireducens]
MKRVEIYTTRTCPYCIAAKALLTKKGVTFEETDVGADPSLRSAMMARANGRRTVPQIFIGGAHVGGCDDLHALDAAGKLDAMLADA